MGTRLSSSLWLAVTFVLLVASPLAAQTGSITGRVTDGNTGAPLAGARIDLVTAAGQSAGNTLADQDGQFRIANVQAGTYTLVATLVGYETRRIEGVRIMAGQMSMQAVSMDLSIFELNPLVVSASRRQEKVIDAPASVAVIDSRTIAERPVTTPVDHLRSIPGVDVMNSGVQSTNVVVRGFNNVFSGSLHALTDNRIAGVPSLRLNALHFIPANDEDVERMEVVLGPGAALYGPNTANGVLHIVTKSPLDAQGTSFSVTGGERSLFHAQVRTAQKLSDNLGFKVSGQYMTAEEWAYTDPVEAAEKAKFDLSPLFKQDLMAATQITNEEADRRIALIGTRDNDISRLGFEGRLDWRPSATSSVILSGGTNLANGIELTGLGAAQAVDWRSSYLQARGNWDRLFVQGYVNMSNAGDTYLLRNGTPITDQSKLYVGQVQHGLSLGERQNFTYGMDLLYTDPVTRGTINGKYEDEDQTTEFGAYLQSETMLHPRVNLVLAGRVDSHSALPEKIFSPRAALVFKPAESQALRLTFNRAFSTPSSLNQFLDLGSAVPVDPNDDRSLLLSQLGYSLRVQGTGTEGFRFKQADGSYRMRSPFAADPQALLVADSENVFRWAVAGLARQAQLKGAPIDATLLGYLNQLSPSAADIPVLYRDLLTGTIDGLNGLELENINRIREETSTTLEVGYKGLIGERMLVTADVWFSRRNNLVTPLTISTPLLLLKGEETLAYLTERFMADLGWSQAQAQGTATQLVCGQSPQCDQGLAAIPAGVISSSDVSTVNANAAQILTTYYNVDDELDLWGTDLSVMTMLNEKVSLTGSLSLVNKDQFETKLGTSVTLNAPKAKGSLALGYRDADSGISGEARARFNEGFPVRSGVYNGTLCIGGAEPGAESCVNRATLLDMMVGYRLPIQGTTLQLSVQNLLNEKHRSFPGVPAVGRMALLRLKYDF